MLFIFDMGNVVSHKVDVISGISSTLGIPEEEIRGYCGEDFKELTKGTITTEQFWQEFSVHFQVTIEEDYLTTCFHPEVDPRMIALIWDLKSSHHRVVCGTNTIESHYRFHQANGDYYVFDKVYASHRMGTAKPEYDFYHYILRAEKALAEDTVFIDDMQVNVDSAAEVGITSYKFVGYEQLKYELLNDSVQWETCSP
ncbi:MAG: HAD-IA family hydrolase [Spirochaetaceae bacterium]|nr:HAD-IA family hydrolase [Spirochaetaceae bacterium]MCF7949674.1 HAD-IA family hydrolase [Spirochaetia bacterium]MCF7951623.1 HAD-IA family hydrolase [Spirochaetaceae bacterium]